jgi:NADPH:quinone reductase-like Zn-dependent oxidoreductase
MKAGALGRDADEGDGGQRPGPRGRPGVRQHLQPDATGDGDRRAHRRSRDEVREIARRVQADLWPALEAGKLRLPVDKVFPLEQAEAAHQRMRTNQHFGKILLKI